METPLFFQSQAFMEFQNQVPGRTSCKIELGDECCFSIRQATRFKKSFFWMPYGDLKEKNIERFFHELQVLAKRGNAIFARFEPAVFPGAVHEKFMNEIGKEIQRKKLGIQANVKRFTPEATLFLDLKLSEEDLLKQMKPKGRYNIKVAQKNGVKIKKYDRLDSASESDFSAFCGLVSETASRDNFSAHPPSYYEKFFRFFVEKKMCSFFAAEKEGKIIAGILVVYFKDTAIYYYGASGYEARQFMAPYLIQWEAVLDAKKRGFLFYDFFGIAPENAKNHPWSGVTDFKKKFGGTVVEFAPAFDIVFQPFWYFLYKLKA